MEDEATENIENQGENPIMDEGGNLDVNPENINGEEETNYENMSIEEILKKNKVEIYEESDTKPMFNEVVVNNKHYKLYLAKNTTLLNCSLMVLNEVNSKKKAFGELLENLGRLDSLNSNFIMKLKGANIFPNRVYLLFDLVLMNYITKKRQTEIETNYKFCVVFYLIEMLSVLQEQLITIEDLRFSLILLDNMDELKFLVPFEQFQQFNKNHENKPEKIEPEYKYDRYLSPEKATGLSIGIQNDIWLIGCIMVEMFSKNEIWSTHTKDEMMRDLKKSFVPKIHPDVPKHMWGIICECLNPFPETRIDSKELLDRYVKLMLKLKIPEMSKHLEKYNDVEVSKLNQTGLDGEDPKAIRKCPLHPRYDAFWFCAKCCEVICDQCKNTIHSEHSKKGFVFDYLEFVNQSRVSIHQYREKFNKYILEANVPQREIYDEILKTNEENIEQLYTDQKAKIEEQFEYFKKLLDDLKTIEIEHLTKFRDFVKTSFETILSNYTTLQNEKEEIEKILDTKEQEFIEFQDMDQIRKEQVMKETIKNEEILVFKKKLILKCVQNFHKDSSKVECLKRYFEIHIDKYKDNKTNDLIRALEKKVENIGKKYTELQMESYFNNLISEFEEIALISSRSYFNTSSRELFSAVTNTKRIFSYNIDQGKFHLDEVEFKQMPIDVFPNYSRSLILNGNLIISGGYDDKAKVMLPYFFYYDRINKRITRLNDMIYGRTAHSIIYIPPHFIVVIAGSGIVKCEKYNMENNTWGELPEISLPRQNCTLFYFNKQYLYAFGGAYWEEGKKSFNFIESVERLNLGFGSVEGSDKWEEIKYYCNPSNLNIKKSVMSVLSYTAKKILLVGGNIAYNTYSEENLQFDFEKNEFSLKDKINLPIATCFPNKTFMYYNDKAYQMDNQGHIFEFDFKQDKFTIIKENNVIKNNSKIG